MGVRGYLPSVPDRALGKPEFAECPRSGTQQKFFFNFFFPIISFNSTKIIRIYFQIRSTTLPKLFSNSYSMLQQKIFHYFIHY